MTPRMIPEDQKAEWLAIWEHRGKPVIELGPGEDIYDLAKFLTGWVSATHEAKLRESLASSET